MNLPSMQDASDTSALKFSLDPQSRRWFGTALIVATGLVAGGYLMGDGLLRAKQAERAVTVRGLAERNVTADLATWTISFSATSSDLAFAQEKVQRDRQALEQFFARLGFPAGALQPTGANVASFTTDGVTQYTVRQRIAMRTGDIARAQKAVAQQFDLVSRGVMLEEGSAIVYSFTKLNDIKPEMVAEATRDALLEQARLAHTLVVSASPGFAEAGSHINLYEEDGYLRFEINVDATQQAGLTVSSHLLKIARVVRQKGAR